MKKIINSTFPLRMFGQVLIVLLTLLFSCKGEHESILIEAESFREKGGWVVDPQFAEQMGSPYLLAHGLGLPVEDATTKINISRAANFYIWVRAKNWAPGPWDSPGMFQLVIDSYPLPKVLGTQEGWNWQYAGNIKLGRGEHQITLRDLTGFDGRCDAIFFSTINNAPPTDQNAIKFWRKELSQIPDAPGKQKDFDLVIVGGGIAGCAAAIAAAEENMQVALIHDRPVLGGNASGEIRVHTLGIYGHFERILRMLDTQHYPNGSPEALQEDLKRMNNVKKIQNIHLFLNWRAYDAFSENETIRFVDAQHTSSGERIRFTAPLFVDCTGDGWIGYWAGAEYMYGRESVDTYQENWDKHGELWSPKNPDNRIMGSSVLWRSKELDTNYTFPAVPWAINIAGNHSASNGEWYWEFSRNDLHQVNDAEEIRDHMLKAIYGSFYNEKQEPGNEKLALEWVGYILGKRESRRLTGDYIYTFNDERNNVQFPDSVVVEVREVDVHYQQNLVDTTVPDFLSVALFYKAGRYYVPYRSLYSKNISNLLMAGRCFSCSHVGLGGPRVMRTTGQMGAAVGYAASICKKYNCSPREVYESHLEEYMELVLGLTR